MRWPRVVAVPRRNRYRRRHFDARALGFNIWEKEQQPIRLNNIRGLEYLPPNTLTSANNNYGSGGRLKEMSYGLRPLIVRNIEACSSEFRKRLYWTPDRYNGPDAA